MPRRDRGRGETEATPTDVDHMERVAEAVRRSVAVRTPHIGGRERMEKRETEGI